VEIDLFTLAAELVNFLILVVLLQRFLYRPIVRIMDERKQKIDTELEEARTKEEQARREARVCAEERRDLEDKRGEMLSAAREEAEGWRREMTAEARAEIEASKIRWNHAIEKEKQTFLEQLRQRTGEEVYSISRRVLGDLAGVELEKLIIDTFLKNLVELEQSKRKEMAAAARRSPHGAMIYSTFNIDMETRSRIDRVVHESIAWDIALGFKTSPELICGIELRAGGRKAAWSLEHYLSSLDEDLSLALMAQPGEGA
jgi:F-type H+-transporting ATPase subunit b